MITEQCAAGDMRGRTRLSADVRRSMKTNARAKRIAAVIAASILFGAMFWGSYALWVSFSDDYLAHARLFIVRVLDESYRWLPALLCGLLVRVRPLLIGVGVVLGGYIAAQLLHSIFTPKLIAENFDPWFVRLAVLIIEICVSAMAASVGQAFVAKRSSNKLKHATLEDLRA